MTVHVPPHLDEREVLAVQRFRGDVEARAYVARLSILQTALDEFGDDPHPTLTRARRQMDDDRRREQERESFTTSGRTSAEV